MTTFLPDLSLILPALAALSVAWHLVLVAPIPLPKRGRRARAY